MYFKKIWTKLNKLILGRLILCCLVFFTFIFSQSVIAQAVVDELYKQGSGGLSPELQRVRTLIRANVLNLARKILEEKSPLATLNQASPTQDWIEWERQLWALYRSQGDWDALYLRTLQIPPSFPIEIRREANIQSADAQIQLNNGDWARRILRKSLLSSGVTEVEKLAIRRMMIAAYMSDNLLREAGITMRKYQADYRTQEPEWLLWSARIYIQLGDTKTAINLLAPLDTPQSRLLRTYARLLDKSISPDQAIARLKEIPIQHKVGNSEVENSGSNKLQTQIRSLLVYAKKLNQDWFGVQEELENLLNFNRINLEKIDAVFPHYTVLDLIESYNKVAQDTANTAGLLIGEESLLFHHALRLVPQEALRKRAVYGYLLQNLSDPIFKLQINNFYIESLVSSNLIDIIPHLYGDKKAFGELILGGNIGLKLSNQALDQGNIELAALVNHGLSELPEGMDINQWMLHSARISIFAGEYDKGAETLHAWIKLFHTLDADQIDQVLQPVFDLQTVGQDILALKLMLEIKDKIKSARHLRELSYWMAESYQASGQYIKAADYYLHSALMKDDGLDKWGESARFQAAESLQSANLIADSKKLYEGLLARTADENRKNQLQKKLQELTLLESLLDHES